MRTVDIGSSGVVFAFMVVSAMVLPKNFQLFPKLMNAVGLPPEKGVLIWKLSSWSFVIVEVVLEAFSIAKGEELFGTSHTGHIGGALGGFLYVILCLKGYNRILVKLFKKKVSFLKNK